jgi:hypothetical protein
MALILPLATDTLLQDNHAQMHNVFVVDGSSPSKSVVVSSVGQVLLNPIRITSGTYISNPLTAYTMSATDMARNVILLVTGTGAATITLASGTNLSGAVPNVTVGQVLPFMVANASTQTVLVNGTAGTTILAGGTSLPVTALQTRTLWALCSGTNTWNVF